MFMKILTGIRSSNLKMAVEPDEQQCRLDIRNYAFSQKVTNEWNKLSNYCVNTNRV